MLIFKTRFDTESVRLIATYLTATLCQGELDAARSNHRARADAYREAVIDTSVTSGVNPSQAKESSAFVDPSSFVLDARKVDPGRFKAPLRVLQALHDLLFTRTSELQKFAKIISESLTLPPYCPTHSR